MSAQQARLGPGAPPHGSGSESLGQQHTDPSMVKLTRGTSCVLCQQRKVRCDKNKPCANCVKAGVECKVIPPPPPRRRKKRFQERDLIDRLKKYETLLAENGVKFDAISHDLKSDGPQNEEVDELENDFEALETSPDANSSRSTASVSVDKYTQAFNILPPQRSTTAPSHSAALSNTKANGEKLQFRASEKLLRDSSDDDEESTIHRAFDTMFADNNGFPFVFSGRQQSTTHFHPSAIQIFQLWQTYIDNVNSLLKITHVPSIQGQIIQASSNLGSAPKNIEALMFGIYAMAVSSMEDGDVEKMFHQTKKDVLAQFFTALQQALLNAGFMRTNDFFTLQAYVLYLFAIRWTVDPRQVFCLIGIAVRIAQRMGLHNDPAGYGLPPFEVEQRRRLWWTIVGYDRRIGEMTGSTVTALSSGGDCKLPINVNDSDLHIDGKELPTAHNGPTEMLFALTRLEMAMAVTSNSNRDSAKINPDRASPSASSGSSSSRQTPVPTIRIAGQDSPSYTFDGFCAHMEGTYLQHCDPKIPLHFFTITMTRQTLAKMRVISYLMRMHTAQDPLPEIERDNLVVLSIQMVEYDNIVHASDSLKPFKWFTSHHFPFPAYMFLVQELRQRCYGPMVERAWEAVASNHKLRGMISNMHSPLHAAFGRHFVKAWDAHSEACIANGREAPTQPAFIAALRDRQDQKHRDKIQGNDPAVDQSQSYMPDGHHGGGQDSPEIGDVNVMMTPPSVGRPTLASSAASSVGMDGTSIQDTADMDWTYMMPSFTPHMGFASGWQGFHNFEPFGGGSGSGPANNNRMGGMGPGGPGGPGSGGMY
ncbi:hypothetical protein QQS21_000664 [Conoideocrella luteorostrata]|uniref:Zn(2)-C6 fungal-type domain-containing protein n=1 Tax=Conoideocrella luteorostrata TaxID=1105319 RepID=A0AAJ0D0U4_9HYPO|nr:hypothetical protein QQS21_000664 [Conoideocrella luteorostrata]